MKEIRAPASRRPGRPRSQKTTAAILQAATELLAEQGLLAMSIDAVAARAGASKATIYRWWGSKEALALDAFEAGFEAQVTPAERDTGSLVGDLCVGVDARVRTLLAPGVLRVFAALLAQAHADPAFGDAYRAQVFLPLREISRQLFARAIARGEISADTDVDMALDLILGAVTYRLFQGHASPDAAFVRTIVDIVVKGLAAGADRAE